jgi:glycosyltransferase involved in cell wall biosynthesis
MKKVILLVAMPDSVHVARWVEQLDAQHWEVHLFSSTGCLEIHAELRGVTVHSPLFAFSARKINLVTAAAPFSFVSRGFDFLLRRVFPSLMLGLRVRRLNSVVKGIRPDLVHSLEMQAAGYLTLEAKRKFTGTFPPWLVTNWGSDIFLFGRLQQHTLKITDVLANCDYYSCECERDLLLAREFGFIGPIMPIFPNAGGFDLLSIELGRSRVPPSARKLIMLKGYQNWAGRALVGLRALSRCSDVLAGYIVVIYSTPPDVLLAAELFSAESGIPVRIIPKNTPHHEMLSLHAQARISIGLSISDGISTSFLEALAMGSFPIQSCTACASEWIEHGISGMVVPPEDPDIIEVAIRTALEDDALVDRASQINWRTAFDRLDSNLLKQKVSLMYSQILHDKDTV